MAGGAKIDWYGDTPDIGYFGTGLVRGEAQHNTPGVTVAGGAILTNLRSIFQTGARLFRTKAGSRLAKIG